MPMYIRTASGAMNFGVATSSVIVSGLWKNCLTTSVCECKSTSVKTPECQLTRTNTDTEMTTNTTTEALFLPLTAKLSITGSKETHVGKGYVAIG
jgi:hypothetical protein